MTKIKYCPIMSYQKQYHDEMYCMENDCAFWDEKRKQCCITTMALAAILKPSSNTAQASYVIPGSYHYTNAASDIRFRLSPDE